MDGNIVLPARGPFRGRPPSRGSITAAGRKTPRTIEIGGGGAQPIVAAGEHHDDAAARGSRRSD